MLHRHVHDVDTYPPGGAGTRITHQRLREWAMPSGDVDRYLAALDEPQREALQQLRQTIVSIVPEAEECIAYGSPAYKLHGKAVAGFAAFTRHLSYLPHSGSVLGAMAAEVAGYKTSKGALQFDAGAPLPADLVRALIDARRREIDHT
jgi:uncharacterized protein YdhG (YjbR/CyaY superfamily)